MLNLKTLNGASPPADPQVPAPHFPAETHGPPPRGLGQRSRAGTAEGAPGLLTHRCPERGARGRSRGRRVTSRLGRAHLGKRADPGWGGAEKTEDGGLGWDAKWHWLGREGSAEATSPSCRAPPRLWVPPRFSNIVSATRPPAHGAEDRPVLESPARDPWPRGSGLKLPLPQAGASRTDPAGRPRDFLFLP